MKFAFSFILLILLISCSGDKSVYWCGDHACINKKEKEAYFKKTLIIEVKELTKKNKKETSELKLIKQKAILNEKKRIKNERQKAKIDKLEEKRKIQQTKELSKQAKVEEKIRIKEEKELAKQIKLEEKKLKKQETKYQSKISKKEKDQNINKIYKSSEIASINVNENNFDFFVSKITKINKSRPYPNINDIPE